MERKYGAKIGPLKIYVKTDPMVISKIIAKILDSLLYSKQGVQFYNVQFPLHKLFRSGRKIYHHKNTAFPSG